MRAGVIGTSVLALTACVSVEPTRMTLPPGLAGLELVRTELSGVNGGRRGEVALGDLGGTYRLSLTRQTYEERNEVIRTEATASLFGPEGPIEMRCQGRQQNVTWEDWPLEDLGGNAVLVPFDYACAFDGEGAPEDAALTLRAAIDPEDGLPSRTRRVGELTWGEERLAIRSANGVPGVAFAADALTGYVVADEGAPVGAVDLLGNRPVVMLPASAPPGDTVGARAALLALSLLQDPEEF